MEPNFRQRVVAVIQSIPKGKVGTYGQIAELAGNPGAARMVVWTINACYEKDKLPWHRVVNSKGTISLPKGVGYELQKSLLEKEGVEFDSKDRIDFSRFLF